MDSYYLPTTFDRAPSLATLRGMFPGDDVARMRRIMKGEHATAMAGMNYAERAAYLMAGGYRRDLAGRRTNNPHLALHMIDTVLNTHGVEMARGTRGTLWYCNTGDTYAPTVGLLYRKGKTTPTWYIGSWGDAVELGTLGTVR